MISAGLIVESTAAELLMPQTNVDISNINMSTNKVLHFEWWCQYVFTNESKGYEYNSGFILI